MSWMDLVGLEAKCSLLLVCAGLLVLLLRRFSASQRHWVWMLAMLGTLVIPVVHFAAPDWEIAVLPKVAVPEPLRISPAVREEAPDFLPASAADLELPAPEETGLAGKPRVPVAHLVALAWAIGVVCMLLPLPVGYVAALRIARKATPVRGSWLATEKRLVALLSMRRKVKVLERTGGQMPMVFGFFRPVVVLPTEGQEWSEQEREAVLAHELAHVKRHDCLIHFICSAALALHWFNPLYAVAMRRMRLEREHACDDFVLGQGAEATAYADQLLVIARTQPCRVPLYGAAITMARKNALEGRLLAILDEGRNRKVLGFGAVLATFLLFVGIAAPLAAVTVAEERSDAPLAEIDGETEAEVFAALAETNVFPASAAEEIAAPPIDVAGLFLGNWFGVEIATDGRLHLLIEENGQALLQGGDLRRRMQWTVNFDELVFTAPDGINTANLDRNGRLTFRKDGNSVAVFGRSEEDLVSRPEPANSTEYAAEHGLESRYASASGISSLNARDKAMAELAVDASRQGLINLTQKALAAISSLNLRDETAGRCARQFMAINQSENAVRIAKQISSLNLRDEILAKIAQGAPAPRASAPARPEFSQQMKKQLETRLQIAAGMTSFTERDAALAGIAADAGALRNVEIALLALRRMTSFSARDKAASHCADQFIAHFMSEEAAQVASTITSFRTKNEVLARIARGKTPGAPSPTIPNKTSPANDNGWSFSYSGDVPLDEAQTAEMQKQMEQMQKQMEDMIDSGAMQSQMKGMQKQMDAMQKQMESMMDSMGNP